MENINANSLATSSATQKAIGQEGETTTSVTYNPRVVALDCAYKGVLNGRISMRETELIYQKIARTFVLKEPGELLYTNNVGTYRIECRPVELPDPQKIAGSFKRFRIELVADNPMWMSQTQFSHRLGAIAGGKRYPLRYAALLARRRRQTPE